jgi:DNA repair protein RadC
MQESLRVILLNTKQQLIKVVAVSSGDKQRIGRAPLDTDLSVCHTYNTKQLGPRSVS